jgi:hypothetical protein
VAPVVEVLGKHFFPGISTGRKPTSAHVDILPACSTSESQVMLEGSSTAVAIDESSLDLLEGFYVSGWRAAGAYWGWCAST